jgi:Predicted aminoglycoside phosphotransferase
VPTVCWLDRDGGPVGTPYYVMEQVPNVGTVGDFPSYHVAGLYHDATPRQREAMWWGCVAAMAAVHRLDWRSLRLEKLLLPEHGSHPLEQIVNYYAAALDWATDGTPRPELAAAVDWLRTHCYEVEDPVLCWGDARLSNVLYGPDQRMAAVLDWEIAYIGDHAADLAWLLFLDWAVSDYEGTPRLPGTPSPGGDHPPVRAALRPAGDASALPGGARGARAVGAVVADGRPAAVRGSDRRRVRRARLLRRAGARTTGRLTRPGAPGTRCRRARR